MAAYLVVRGFLGVCRIKGEKSTSLQTELTGYFSVSGLGTSLLVSFTDKKSAGRRRNEGSRRDSGLRMTGDISD